MRRQTPRTTGPWRWTKAVKASSASFPAGEEELEQLGVAQPAEGAQGVKRSNMTKRNDLCRAVLHWMTLVRVLSGLSPSYWPVVALRVHRGKNLDESGGLAMECETVHRARAGVHVFHGSTNSRSSPERRCGVSSQAQFAGGASCGAIYSSCQAPSSLRTVTSWPRW